MAPYTIKTFYSFTIQDETRLEQRQQVLEQKAVELEVLGLMILGREGFNTTLTSTNEQNLDRFIEAVLQTLEVREHALIKTSRSDKRPFKKFEIKVRSEIVTFDRADFVPKGAKQHLSPEDWNTYLDRDDVVVIDTRNDYETKIGVFDKALDLKLKEFTDLAEKLKNLDTDREKPHLIYCTGGIRCEKAIFEMEAQGFKNVYQLDGGILNYLEKFPKQKFKGECFVFDSRVAVDQNLKPSEKYSLCPHCGDTSSQDITCRKCDEPSKLCEDCFEKSRIEFELETCSKNCKHHYKLRPGTKGPQQKQFYHES